MDGFSLGNIQAEPLWCAVIVTVAVAALIGLSFGFSGHVQF